MHDVKDPRVDDLIKRVILLEVRRTPSMLGAMLEADSAQNIFVMRDDIREINHKLDAILAHLDMDIKHVNSHYELVPKKETR